MSTSLKDKETIVVDIIFFDYSAAFDKVLFNVLVERMAAEGISYNLVNILSDLTVGRQQVVMFNGSQSCPFTPSSGVIQGGVSSPLIYNIYTNRVINNSDTRCFKFADDTVFIRARKSLKDVTVLQKDIDDLYSMSTMIGLTMNVLKMKHLVIGFKEDNVTYQMAGRVIDRVTSHKHLGVYIDSRLSFNENTNYMILRASQQIGMIKKICKRCDGWTHLALYRTYVLPILEYCFGCWAPTKTQMERKEKVQRKFTKFVCYKLGFEDLSYNHRLRLLSMKSLEHRRQLFLMKYLKNLCGEESILSDFVTLK